MATYFNFLSCKTISDHVRIILIAGITFCITSCDSCKTQPDFKDSTPPELTWIVTHESGEKDTIAGTGNSAVTMGEAIYVLAIVKDDGGIVELTTSRTTGYDCLEEGLQSPSFGPVEQTIPLSLDSNGEALNLFPVAFDVNTLLICPQGSDFQQGNFTLKCSALNFANLKTEGVLSIHVNRQL